MDEKILDLLLEMNKDLKNLTSDVHELKSNFNRLESDVHTLKSDMQGLKSEMHELKSDMQGLKSEMHELKSDMHKRFDQVDTKLEGVGHQFELTNELRSNEVDFISNKVNKLEKEVYFLKVKMSS